MQLAQVWHHDHEMQSTPRMTKKSESQSAALSRRGFLGGFGLAGGAAMVAGCTVGSSFETNPRWQARAEELKANGIYTTGAPGIWAGKEAAHTPTIAKEGDIVTISCTHGMAEGHWVTTIFVEDDTGTVLHLEEFVGRGPSLKPASTSFRVPPEARSLTAYAYCNLHDCWESATLTL